MQSSNCLFDSLLSSSILILFSSLKLHVNHFAMLLTLCFCKFALFYLLVSRSFFWEGFSFSRKAFNSHILKFHHNFISITHSQLKHFGLMTNDPLIWWKTVLGIATCSIVGFFVVKALHSTTTRWTWSFFS